MITFKDNYGILKLVAAQSPNEESLMADFNDIPTTQKPLLGYAKIALTKQILSYCKRMIAHPS